MVKKKHIGAGSISILIIVVIILLVSLAYFYNSDIKKQSDVEVKTTVDTGVKSTMAEKELITVTNGIYYKSKGIVDIGVWNEGEKDVEIDKVVIVSGDITDVKTTIETAPSKTAGYILKPGERKSFEIEVSELPDEIWVVPAENQESVGILSKQYIKIGE